MWGCVLYLVLPPLDRWLCTVCHRAFAFFFLSWTIFKVFNWTCYNIVSTPISKFLAVRLARCQLQTGICSRTPRLKGEVSTTGLQEFPAISLLSTLKLKQERSQLPFLLHLILLKFLCKIPTTLICVFQSWKLIMWYSDIKVYVS